MAPFTIIDNFGRSVPLNAGVLSMGPGKTNPIVLDEVDGPDVTAELIYDGTNWVLRPSQDIISIMLNEEIVKDHRILRHADTIKVGANVLRFHDGAAPAAKSPVDVNANMAAFRSTGDIQTFMPPTGATAQPVRTTLPTGHLGIVTLPPPRTLAEAQQQRENVIKEIAQRQTLINSLEGKVKSNNVIAVICLIIGFFVFGILWIVAIILYFQNGQHRGKINQYTNEMLMLQQQLYQIDQALQTLRS